MWSTKSPWSNTHMYTADLCPSAGISMWGLAVGPNWCVLRICRHSYQSPDGVYRDRDRLCNFCLLCLAVVICVGSLPWMFNSVYERMSVSCMSHVSYSSGNSCLDKSMFWVWGTAWTCGQYRIDTEPVSTYGSCHSGYKYNYILKICLSSRRAATLDVAGEVVLSLVSHGGSVLIYGIPVLDFKILLYPMFVTFLVTFFIFYFYSLLSWIIINYL